MIKISQPLIRAKAFEAPKPSQSQNKPDLRYRNQSVSIGVFQEARVFYFLTLTPLI